MKNNINIIGNHDHVDSPTLITPWTIAHFLSGWFAFLGFKLIFPNKTNLSLAILWFLIHTIYEFKDYYETYSMRISYTNTFVNSIGDTIFTMLGFYVGVIVGYSTVTMINVGLLLSIYLLLSTRNKFV